MIYSEAGKAGEVSFLDDELESCVGVLADGEVGGSRHFNLLEASTVTGIDDETIFGSFDT